MGRCFHRSAHCLWNDSLLEICDYFICQDSIKKQLKKDLKSCVVEITNRDMEEAFLVELVRVRYLRIGVIGGVKKGDFSLVLYEIVCDF